MKHGTTALIAGSVGAAALAAMTAASRPTAPVTPAGDAVFTTTGSVTCLAISPDGTLWAGTRGGVLRRSREGTWRKFTRQDGLPSHEVRGIAIAGNQVTVEFPAASAVWKGGEWRMGPAPRPPARAAGVTCQATWSGATWTGTPTGLWLRRDETETIIPLPPSPGTHISALLPRGNRLWAAVFGDGLWSFDGKNWERAEIALPAAAREITALADHGTSLWLGTRRAGVWEYDGRRWRQYRLPDEPADHNCQAIAIYRGELFVSTLEEGLVVRSTKGWRQVTKEALSSDAPRQMVVFGAALYLRHGSGKVDTWDGRRWTRDVCSHLPRKQAMALAADARRLYVAQWGGWSEYDGRTWSHHLNHPELQGLPITALLPDGDTLWIGTQSRGMAEIDRTTGLLRWHDERHGLTDDWVTVIARVGSAVHAGTFVGGLARWNGQRWTPSPELAGQNVTALAPDSAGGAVIGTRTALWHQAAGNSLTSLHPSRPFLDREIQALCPTDGGLWVGTRTGLFFLAWPRLATSVSTLPAEPGEASSP